MKLPHSQCDFSIHSHISSRSVKYIIRRDSKRSWKTQPLVSNGNALGLPPPTCVQVKCGKVGRTKSSRLSINPSSIGPTDLGESRNSKKRPPCASVEDAAASVTCALE